MRRLCALLAIIALLLPFGMETEAQNQSKPLLITPTGNYLIAGTFSQPFKEIKYIKRTDNGELLLMRKNYAKPIAKITTDKGVLRFEKSFQEYHDENKILRYYYGREIVDCFDLNNWKIEGLNRGEKSVTISIYDYKTNQLTSQTTYNIKGIEQQPIYTAEVHYTDVNGKEQAIKGTPLSSLEVNYSKPMKVVVNNGWDKFFKVDSYELFFYDSMGCTKDPTIEGDLLENRTIKRIEEMQPGKTIVLRNVFFTKDGKQYKALDVQITK